MRRPSTTRSIARLSGRVTVSSRVAPVPATFTTERDSRVLTVLFDVPPHNFMGRRMVRELDALTRSLLRERSIRAVVLTGAREGLFITHYEIEEILAGAEGVGPPPSRPAAAALVRVAGAVKRVPAVRRLVELTPVRGLLELHRVHDLFRRMNRSDKIFIAAINGPATGGGCELALACDLRYMADDDSFRIGLPEMTIGLPPGAGGSQRLARALGSSRALEMMLEGRTLTPAEARSVGLVHHIAPAASLRAVATEAAHRLARRSPAAVRALKRSVYEGSAGGLEKGMATERKLFLWAGGSKPARRGMRAFTDSIAEEAASPWADAEKLRPWQRGDLVDLGSLPPSPDKGRPH
jgi:enoyl-CoA hydratase